MNKPAGILYILIFVYQLIDSILKRSMVLILYNIVGIVLLIISFIWDKKQGQRNLKEKPYENYVFIYFLLGIQIKNLITYINKEYLIGVLLYIEGTLALSILTIYECIRFFFPDIIKTKSKALHWTIAAIELLKIILLLYGIISKKITC